MNETVTKGFERGIPAQVVHPSASYSFSPYRLVHETRDFEDAAEKELLVKKLDEFRNEPTVNFGSTVEALHFLRSRIKPST